MKHHLFWHKDSNYLAVFHFEIGGLPTIEILDDGFLPFVGYPIAHLIEYVGWIDLGELK